MRPVDDQLSGALEALRHRPIVDESREFARNWAEESQHRRVRRNRVLGSAGVVAVCAAAFAFFGLPGGHVIGTGVGETSRITLEDGSHVVVDAQSKLQVSLTNTARDVQLLQGQAHFEVAKDPRRPFKVHTQFAEVLAVGTQFDVSVQATRTVVTLIAGRVNVMPVSDSAVVSNRQPATLLPGQQVGVLPDGKVQERKEVKIENVTAWQRGTVVLDDMPLSEALATLNRYSSRQIVINGDALQSQRVSGVFRIGDVDTAALVLERYFGLRETSRTDHAILLVK